MTFTELCSLYEIYKKMSTAPAPTPAPTTAISNIPTPAPTPTTAIQNVPLSPSIGVVPTMPPSLTPAPAQPTPAPVTNNDLMAALQAMQIPTVRGEAPKPESIDDVICRIAGIKTNTEKK